jgi:arylsulfatase A-like enzyme
LLASIDEHTHILVVSDHGFEAYLVNGRLVPGHFLATPGVFVLWGPAVKKGVRLERPSVIDIAPTVLHAIGLPVGRDMEGRVLSEAFLDGTKVAFIGSYGQLSPELDTTAGPEEEVDDRVLEQLIALGYVE